jgi:hypothetical protein
VMASEKGVPQGAPISPILEPVINFSYVGTEKHFENCLYIVNTSGH